VCPKVRTSPTHPKHGSRNSLLHALDTHYLPLIAKDYGIGLATPGMIIKKARKTDTVDILMADRTNNIFPRLDFDYPTWAGLASHLGTRGSKHDNGQIGGVQDTLAWMSVECPVCGQDTRDVMNALTMRLTRADNETKRLIQLRNDLQKTFNSGKKMSSSFVWKNVCCVTHARIGIFELQAYRTKIVNKESKDERRIRAIRNHAPKDNVMELRSRPRHRSQYAA
jgi:hypothetical protein